MKNKEKEYFHLENMIAILSENLGNNQNILPLLYEAVDRAAVLYAIKKFKNNKTKISNFLGISRGTLQKKLQHLGLDTFVLG